MLGLPPPLNTPGMHDAWHAPYLGTIGMHRLLAAQDWCVIKNLNDFRDRDLPGYNTTAIEHIALRNSGT